MNKILIEKAREFVETECKKPNNKYGYGPYVEHFAPMVKHSKKLCGTLGGDIEIVMLAAWLHDIGSIIYDRKNHHKTSAIIAKKFLENNDYNKEKTKLVLKCILHHRQSTNFHRNSLEEKIITDADAICNFDMIPSLFFVAFSVEKLSRVDGLESVKKKLQNKWKRLHFKESRDLIKPKYKAIMLLLKKITKP